MDRGKVLRRAAALGGVLVLGALAACTGPGPVETITPTETSTPAPTASASATPSASPTPLTDEQLLAILPPGAGANDEEGARITAEYMIQLAGPLYDGQGLDLLARNCQRRRVHVLRSDALDRAR